jgi:hypothetical protein
MQEIMNSFNEYPSIQLPDKLQDIFLLETINDEYRDKKFITYTFNNMPVPRVSNILKDMINREYLIGWAAKIGMKEMTIERNKATTIGTRVHEMIEEFLISGKDLSIDYKTPPSYMKKCNTAYNNFKHWLNRLNSLGYNIEEVIAIEKTVSCPYYGGTIDCICKINGAVYIIDFKTSKSIIYEYIIQTCAYMWLINNGFCPDIDHIDGIGIIRVDKEIDGKYNDLFLNNHIPYQREILDRFTSGFGSLLNSYYHNIDMQLLFQKYKRNYNLSDTLNSGVNINDYRE